MAEHVNIRGCDVYLGEQEHPFGAPFGLAYNGPLGGEHAVTGRIVVGSHGGRWAVVQSISKRGFIGRWNPKQLTERMVDVLRELEIEGFDLPNGKRYEILDGIPGVRPLTDQT